MTNLQKLIDCGTKLPAETLELREPLIVRSGMKMRGSGARPEWFWVGLPWNATPGTKLQWVGEPGMAMITTEPGAHDMSIANLTLDAVNVQGITGLLLNSAYNCKVKGVSFQAMDVGLDMVADAGHCVWNDIERAVFIQQWIAAIRMRGVVSPLRAVTLNSFRHTLIRNPYRHGIDFACAVDNNCFFNTIIQGDSASMIGVEFNTAAPTIDQQVYENQFYNLSIDSDAPGAKTVVVNNTTHPSLIMPYKAGGSQWANGKPVVNAGGKLNWMESHTGKLFMNEFVTV